MKDSWNKSFELKNSTLICTLYICKSNIPFRFHGKVERIFVGDTWVQLLISNNTAERMLIVFLVILVSFLSVTSYRSGCISSNLCFHRQFLICDVEECKTSVVS